MNGVTKREPALVTMATLWLLTNVGSLVVQRWGWMGSDQWSTLTSALVPLVSALVAAGAGWLLRRVVTPAWNWLEDTAPAVADAVDDLLPDVGQLLAEADEIYPTPEPEPAQS